MTLAFTDSNTFSGNSTQYTFSNASIGTASATRDVFVAVVGTKSNTGAQSISSVTIGGSAATELFQENFVETHSSIVGFYVLRVTTGTTTNIVSNWSATMGNTATVVWTTDDLTTEYLDHLADSASDEQTGALAVELNVKAGDYVLAAAAGRNDPISSGWTGATVRYADDVEDARFDAADVTPSSADATYDVSLAWSSSSTELLGAIVLRLASTGFHPGRPMMITG